MLIQSLIHRCKNDKLKFLILFLLTVLVFVFQSTSAKATLNPLKIDSKTELPTTMVGLDLPQGSSLANNILVPMPILNRDALGNGQTYFDNNHEVNPLTIVLDFNDPTQSNTADALGNIVTTFDVTQFGFAPHAHDLVVDAIYETIRDHYFSILASDQFAQSPLMPGKDLAIDIVIGDIGTPPANGATEYYYLQIGTAVAGECTTSLGCASLSAIRDENGVGPKLGFSSGAVVGSIFTNNINAINFLSPTNALTSGNIDFTRHAIAGTTTHEVGHAMSLLHLNRSDAITPTGLPPLMASGATGLPNQERIFDRDFAISGQNNEDGGAIQRHIQQLIDAVGVHNSEDLGDAPDSYGTLRTSNGARHLAIGPYLGNHRDTETNPNAPLNGFGDDAIGIADEDGVNVSMLFPNGSNQTATITVQSSSSAFLDAWIDFDRNGSFEHPQEHLNGGVSIAVITGTNSVSFVFPASATTGASYGRFRLSSAGNLDPTGWSADGEVEDYSVPFFHSSVFLPIVLRQ